MPKAIVCVIGASIVNSSIPSLSYSVVVIGPPNYSYAADYEVNTSISLSANLLAWRNKVIAQALENVIVLTPSDIIVFGGPS